MSKGVDFRKNNLIKVEHVKRVGIVVLVGCMACGLTSCGSEDKSYESAYEKALGDIKEKTDEILNEVTTNKEEVVTTVKEETTTKEEVTTEKATKKKAKKAKTKKKKATDIDPDFKAAMDAYYDFWVEYADFMENYDATDMSALTEYMEFLEKTDEWTEKWEEWDEDDMNEAELAYYLDINAKVQKLMLKTSAGM